MNRNNLGKFIFVILVLVWSFYEMYPPVGRNLATEFQDKAVRKDTNFNTIVVRLQNLQKDRPERPFANLVEAVGTNDITHYFPFYEVKGELNPKRAVLNRLQRDAAGKIRLGLDLQGGTSFTVEMGTNQLTTATNSIIAQEGREAALSQASEVLRKRVDKFGVAEPVIQPEGRLSHSDSVARSVRGRQGQRARANIQKRPFWSFAWCMRTAQQLLKQGMTEPGYEVLKEKDTMPDGSSRITPYLVKKKPEMTGQDMSPAPSCPATTMGRPEINFTLNSKGAEIFAKVTREQYWRINWRSCWTVNWNRLPTSTAPIEGGSGVITGTFTEQRGAANWRTCWKIRCRRRCISLPRSSVDPTLGSDTVKSGVYSAVIGTIAVAAFMVIYYLFCRRGGGRGADHEHHHFAGCHVFHRHHADAAGHCGHCADHRHGGGCERADFRAHSGRIGQGQIIARRIGGGL